MRQSVVNEIKFQTRDISIVEFSPYRTRDRAVGIRIIPYIVLHLHGDFYIIVTDILIKYNSKEGNVLDYINEMVLKHFDVVNGKTISYGTIDKLTMSTQTKDELKAAITKEVIKSFL